MVRTAVYYAQRVALLCQTAGKTLDPRKAGALEVYHCKSAQSASRLIHKSAGLAEEMIFSILSDPGHFNRLEHRATAEAVEDAAYEHFIGGRRGQTGTGGHI